VRHPFTLDGRAGAAVEVLDHLGIREPVNWVGNAWGGQAGTLSAAAQTPLLWRTLLCQNAQIGRS
jgi:pimeloyl-ACP methyl ester carboxylesterase